MANRCGVAYRKKTLKKFERLLETRYLLFTMNHNHLGRFIWPLLMPESVGSFLIKLPIKMTLMGRQFLTVAICSVLVECHLPAVGPGGLRWGFFFFGWDGWLIGLRFVFGAWGGSLGASVRADVRVCLAGSGRFYLECTSAVQAKSDSALADGILKGGPRDRTWTPPFTWLIPLQVKH